MSEPTECPGSFSTTFNIDHIQAIKKAHGIFSQTDEQVATGVIVSYIEGSWAGRHLAIWAWAYVEPPEDKAKRLVIGLTDGQSRQLDNICVKMRMGRTNLVRWVVADTAAQTGMMFASAE